jgi:hypothetical protein
LRQQIEHLWHQRLDVGPSDCKAHTLAIHRIERYRSWAVIDAATGASFIGRGRVERGRQPLTRRTAAGVCGYPITAMALGRGLRLDGIGADRLGDLQP